MKQMKIQGMFSNSMCWDNLQEQYEQNASYKDYLYTTTLTINKVADAASRKVTFLVTMSVEAIGSEYLKELYEVDQDLRDVTMTFVGTIYKRNAFSGWILRNQPCISRSSLQKQILQDLHGGGLNGHL